MTSDTGDSINPWDVFINLLAVIALYVTVYGAISLLFQFANISWPQGDDVRSRVLDSARYAVALTLIFFPAFVWAWRSIARDFAVNPAKSSRWVRTCPIYLTLFLAGLFLLSDIAGAVYYSLTGELDSRVIFKVLAILVVSGSVFIFYRNDLRRQPGKLSPAMSLFAYGASITAAALVIVGIVVGGSPASARAARMDQTRVEDLNSIQLEIISYWGQNKRVPQSLANLNVSGLSVPRDPVTSADYSYRPTGVNTFELCADFALADDAKQDLPGWQAAHPLRGDWSHPAGHTCFVHTVNMDKVP